RRLLPDPPGVRRQLRPDPRAAATPARARGDLPPGADEPGPGDLRRRRRRSAVPDPGPGLRGGRGADVDPLPPARRRREPAVTTPLLITGADLLGRGSGDLLVVDGAIAAVGPDAAAQAPSRAQRYHADGLVALPGL